MAGDDDEARPRRSSDRSGERSAKRSERDPDKPRKKSKTAERDDVESGDRDRKARPEKSRSSDGHGEEVSTATIASAALRQIGLTGRDAEGITGIRRTDDGWAVEVEVVEVRRTPATTDLLALYEVDLDASGEFVGYRRTRRYARGASTPE